MSDQATQASKRITARQSKDRARAITGALPAVAAVVLSTALSVGENQSAIAHGCHGGGGGHCGGGHFSGGHFSGSHFSGGHISCGHSHFSSGHFTGHFGGSHMYTPVSAYSSSYLTPATSSANINAVPSDPDSAALGIGALSPEDLNARKKAHLGFFGHLHRMFGGRP